MKMADFIILADLPFLYSLTACQEKLLPDRRRGSAVSAPPFMAVHVNLYDVGMNRI